MVRKMRLRKSKHQKLFVPEASQTFIVKRNIWTAFQYVAQNFFENHSRWDSNVILLTQTSRHKVGLGTTGREIRQSPVGTIRGNIRVTKYKAPNWFSFTIESDHSIVEVEFTFTAREENCQLNRMIKFTPKGWHRLLAPWIHFRLKRQSHQTMDRLKSLLESSHIPQSSVKL